MAALTGTNKVLVYGAAGGWLDSQLTDEPTRSLPDALDDAAIALAAAIRARAAEPNSDLIELTKAFTIVADYATDRAKAQAELTPKKGNKIDGLRDRFNGAAYSGRGRPRKGQTAGGNAGGDAAMTPPPTPEPHLMEVLVAAFGAAGLALSARALLLLAIVGGFALAMRPPDVRGPWRSWEVLLRWRRSARSRRWSGGGGGDEYLRRDATSR